MSPVRPLLAAYGGGHTHIIAAIAEGFAARGDLPNVIGFTTAYRELLRQGVAASPVTVLLDPAEDEEWLALADSFTEKPAHPEVTIEESRAYFALGLRDLVGRLGRHAALARVNEEGRRAFEPIEVMRRYLRAERPDIVITTTSPRFELALLKAARLEGVPSLAVGDLFLVKERDWILDPGFAKYLAVLSSEVARELIANGFPAKALRITGNPAFDRLASVVKDTARRSRLRAKLGLDNKTVILYPAPSSKVSMIGRPFLDISDVISSLERLCREDARYAYLIRPHPNRPFDLPEGASHGKLDNGSLLNAEDAILVADIVCVEASTMGLQAALIGRPVICIGFSDYVLYPSYGLGHAADTFEEAINIIREDRASQKTSIDMPALGSATSNVLDFVDYILSTKTNEELR